jgi:DNA-binding NtrC family response regulator
LPVGSPVLKLIMSTAASLSQKSSRTMNILIIDDEAPVLNVACRMVDRMGHSAVGTATAVAAKEHLQNHGAETHLVMVDMRLGKDSGIVLAREIRAQWPHLIFVGMGGDLAGEANRAKQDGLLAVLLAKPFGYLPLQQLLEEVSAGMQS